MPKRYPHTEPYADEGRRLRHLRQAEGFALSAFATHLGWTHNMLHYLEIGKYRVSVERALELRDRIAGFDPMWLWTGDPRHLAPQLYRRIMAEQFYDTVEGKAIERKQRRHAAPAVARI